MTYLFSSNVEVSNDQGNPLPVSGNIGVLNGGSIVTLLNPLPVTLGSTNITIIGNTNIIDTVTVLSTPENPVHTHITEIGTSGNLLSQGIDYMPIFGNVRIDSGNVAIFGNIAGITTLPNINVNPYTLTGITNNVNINTYSLTGITNNVNVNAVTVTGITNNVNINTYSLTGITNNVNVVVQGNISGITSLPNISGNVHVYGNVGIDGNVNVNPISVTGITSNINVNPLSVTVTSIPEVEIKNDVGNAIPITGTVTMITNANAAPVVSFADTAQMDSTDRLRVSLLGQQWWYVPAIDKDGDLRIQEKFQGNSDATSTFIQNLASVRLSSGLYYNSNVKLTGTAIRASRRRHKTRPGVSGEWNGIVNWDGLQTNVVKRIGMFTNYNGIFFEANATCVSTVVRRRLTDGTLIEDRTPHWAWNKDQMDGTGASRYNWNVAPITANVTSVITTSNIAIAGDGTVYNVQYQMAAGEETKLTIGNKFTVTGITPTSFNDTGLITAIDTVNHRANIAFIQYPGTYSSATNAKLTSTPFHAIHGYWFDYNGSRISRVRFGLRTDAGKIIVHEYLPGEIGTQYESAPSLMDRKEIVNVGQPVAFLPSMTIGGSSVGIESSPEINPGFGVAQSNVAVNFSKTQDINKEFAIVSVGIRIGEPYQRSDLQVNKIQLVDIGNLNPQNAGIFQWRLVLNPTFAGTAVPAATNVGKATRAYYYSAGTTISGGITLVGGYAQGTFTGDVQTALNFLNMGSNVDYTDSDLLVLTVKYLVNGSSDSNMLATISYTEDL